MNNVIGIEIKIVSIVSIIVDISTGGYGKELIHELK